MTDDGSYIRQYYNVPAYVGTKVNANGYEGVIVGFDGAYLVLLLEGADEPTRWHPTWKVQYLD